MALTRPTTAAEETMEKIKMSKHLPRELSNVKIVYSRAEDGRDSMFIKNCIPKSKFNIFGAVGREDMEFVFYSLLLLIDVNADKLKGMCNEKWLMEVIGCIKVDDRSKMNMIMTGEPHKKIEIRMVKWGKIEMMNLIEAGAKRDCQNGVYLYISEALKLVKHMANTLDIGDSPMTDRFTTVKDIDEDDFF